MARRVNIFGQPLAYDVGVEYVDKQPQQRKRPINLDRDDVSSATKETVVKYVGDLTHGVEGNRSNANEFPVDGTFAVEKSVTTTDGTSAPLTQNTNPVYIEGNTRAGRILESYSDSSQAAISKDEPLLDTHGDAAFVKKGKSAAGAVNGNHLLSDMEGNPHPDVVTKYISPILSNNRFSPERKMSSIDSNDKKFNPDHPEEGYGSYKRHRRLGVDMTDAQIANVGPMLTLRATKELDSISREGYGAKGPEGTGAKAASLLPGLAQVGIARVSTDDLEVDSVLRALIAGETEGGNINEGEDGPRTVLSMNTSYGQMNNVLEKFSGLLPLGMVAAGAALSIALSIAMKAILAIFLLITNASSANSQKRDSIGRFIPGDSRYNPAFNKITFPPIPLPAKLFGLVECVNPYGDAVTEGIKVFFGGSIGGSLARVLESPGFYVVFCRNVVRSAADLARGLEDVGKGSPIAIAENIIGFIDVIKSSKVVAVMNMFAQIGDVSLQQATRLARFDAGEERTSDSEIDNIEGLNAMRNRKPGSLALAWGAATTPSTLILPANVARAMMGGRPGLLTGMLSNTSNIDYVYTTQRLSPQDVEKIEDVLNAEYVPFYFQDLRTNEFVSFHAFIGSLTENYTANYDSIEGYGRVDAIKMYRSTARKISVQFTIAATNADDFDAMWVKINKLTTLVYPQWSKGTLLNDGQGNHFVQPFSQIPSASPLMRVRVGDLWTSNYSKFSLARIFGLGNDSTFKLKEFTHVTDSKINEKMTAIKDVVEKIRANDGELLMDSEWLLEPGDYEASTKDTGAIGAALGALASAVGAGASNPRVTIKLRVPTNVTIKQVLNSNAYAVLITDREGLPSHVQTAQFLVSRSHLSISPRTLFTYGVRESTVDEDPLSNEQAADKTMNLANFFSSENNALVKAYESSKGRGLAAFVESMDFDWFDGGNVMWETGVAGSRAPKMCKVTMNMSVVHDIAPGMDADGFNRAPVYNVGGPSNAMAGRKPSDEGKELESAIRKARKSLL